MDSVACEVVDFALPSLNSWKLNSTFYLHGLAWGFQGGSAFPWPEVEEQKRAGLLHAAFERHPHRVKSGNCVQTFVLS